MRNIFSDVANAPDHLKTTLKGKDIEHTAFQLGQGDAADLVDAGLMPKSNAAMAILESIKDREDRKKRFEDLVYEQIRKALDDIYAEIEWLDEQIKIEEQAIQANNTDIDFIRTLDEDNIMDKNGEVRDEVKALLAKHGYTDVDDMDVTDILLITQTIETDLHNDNIIRKGRIDDYQDRRSVLRSSAQRALDNLPDDIPQDIKDKAQQIASSEPYEVTYRAMNEAYTKSEVVAEVLEKAESDSNFAVETSTFDFSKPV